MNLLVACGFKRRILKQNQSWNLARILLVHERTADWLGYFFCNYLWWMVFFRMQYFLVNYERVWKRACWPCDYIIETISSIMPERLPLASPERRANTKTTQDNYPPLVHLFFTTQKESAWWKRNVQFARAVKLQLLFKALGAMTGINQEKSQIHLWRQWFVTQT